MTTQGVDIGGRVIKLTNLDKVLYPATGTTKAEVLHYYAVAGPALIAGAHDRPVTRIRWPNGTGAASFFEKNLPSGAPAWIPRFTARHSGEASGKGEHDITYPVLRGADAQAALIWMVQQGALELHAPQWRVGAAGALSPALSPDRLVIDLDPGAPAGLAECCEVALLVKVALEHGGLEPRAVTSGSKGMQIYADLPKGHPAVDSPDIHAKALAQALAQAVPDLVEWRMTKALRPGKVFVDWSQNNPAKTTILPWSLRGKAEPSVAVPVTWAEVSAGIAGQIRIGEALDRLSG